MTSTTDATNVVSVPGRSYESIRTEAIVARKSSDQNDWKLGDLGVECEDLALSVRRKMDHDKAYAPTQDESGFSKDARQILERLADDIGLGHKAMMIRTRISRRVTTTGDLAWIRRSTLTYATMRELYAIPSDDDLNILAKKAVSQNMSVRDVRSEMETFRDTRAVESGLYLCKTCAEAIADVQQMVALSLGKNRAVFCGLPCTRAYLDAKMKDEGYVLTDSGSYVLPKIVVAEVLVVESDDFDDTGGNEILFDEADLEEAPLAIAL